MAPELTALIKAGRELTLEDRFELARQMLISADNEPENDPIAADGAWKLEFRRRVDDVENGRVRLVDGAETMRLARERIARRSVESFA